MVIKFKDIVNKAEWFSKLEQEYWKSNKTICPLCSHKLIKKWEGMVCQNSRCLLNFKLGKGWVYLKGNSKNNLKYF